MSMEEPAVVSSVPMLAGSEEVGLKVISIMKEAYGTLPAVFWGLSRAADLLTVRGFIVDEDSFDIYRRRLDDNGGRYSIASLKILWWSLNEPLIISPGVKTVSIETRQFDSDLTLCDGIEELLFHDKSDFNKPIKLPQGLSRLVFGSKFNCPVTLPEGLKELAIGPWYGGENERELLQIP